MDAIKWINPEILGSIILAVATLMGVLLTIYLKKNKENSEGETRILKQTSIFSKKSKQYQAGRDISIKSKPTKKGK